MNKEHAITFNAGLLNPEQQTNKKNRSGWKQWPHQAEYNVLVKTEQKKDFEYLKATNRGVQYLKRQIS